MYFVVVFLSEFEQVVESVFSVGVRKLITIVVAKERVEFYIYFIFHF